MATVTEARLEAISLAARSFAHDLGNLMLPGVSGFAQIAESEGLTDRQRRMCTMAEAAFAAMASPREALETVIDRPREATAAGEDLEAWWRRSVGIIRPLVPGRPAIRSEFAADLPAVGLPGPLIGRALLAVLLDAAEQQMLEDELSLTCGAGDRSVRIILRGFRGDTAGLTDGIAIATAALSPFDGTCAAADQQVALTLPRHSG